MRRGFAYAQQPPRGKTSYMPVAQTEPLPHAENFDGEVS